MALLCVVIAFSVQDLQLVKRIKQEQIATQSAMLAMSVFPAVANKNLSVAQDILKASQSRHGVVAAMLLLPDQTLLTSVNFPSLSPGSVVEQSQVRALIENRNLPFKYHIHFTPITAHHKNLGSLVMVVSMEDIEQRVFLMFLYGGMAFVLALFISMVVAAVIQRIVSKPLNNLLSVYENVHDTRNYSLRAEVETSDEIGALAKGFNRMLHQIELRDANLEKQVRVRTRELEKLADQFRYRAFHDNLTGLPNRALLLEEFGRAVAHAERVGNHFALLLLDLDDFKSINDDYGHDFGDEFLKEVAHHIRRCVRREDLVCRLGGDEFLLLLEDIQSIGDLKKLAENLAEDLISDIYVNGETIALNMSIGATLFPEHGRNLEQLKCNADIAMYHSKAAGKKQLTLYNHGMHHASEEKSQMFEDIRRALIKGELELHYQPQIEASTGRVIGAEALMRWQHPKQRLLVPAEFFPVGEEMELIRALDYFAITKACKQCGEWNKKFGEEFRVGVNLSRLHFQSLDIVAEVQKALSKAHLPAKCLMIELSETLFLEESNTVFPVVEALRKLGVRVALDNFGVGQSTLFCLRSLPVDLIKLDRSFTQSLESSTRAQGLVRGVLTLARDIQVQTIVEGVETERQKQVLVNLGADGMQGFVFAKPCLPEKFETWFAQYSKEVCYD